MQPDTRKGGKRKGAGRKAGLPTFTRSIRTTAEGWKWLETQAGTLSVGMWARKQAGASESAGIHPVVTSSKAQASNEKLANPLPKA